MASLNTAFSPVAQIVEAKHSDQHGNLDFATLRTLGLHYVDNGVALMRHPIITQEARSALNRLQFAKNVREELLSTVQTSLEALKSELAVHQDTNTDLLKLREKGHFVILTNTSELEAKIEWTEALLNNPNLNPSF